MLEYPHGGDGLEHGLRSPEVQGLLLPGAPYGSSAPVIWSNVAPSWLGFSGHLSSVE